MMKISRIETVLIAGIFLLCGLGFLGMVSAKGIREIRVLKDGISTQGIIVNRYRVWWGIGGGRSHSPYHPVIEYKVNSRPHTFIAEGIPRHLIHIGSMVDVAYDAGNPEMAIKDSALYVYGRLIPKLILNLALVLTGLYILRKSQKLPRQGSFSVDI